MPDSSIGKVTVSFRGNPEIVKKFHSIVYDQYGYGMLSQVFEDFMKSFVEKIDGVNPKQSNDLIKIPNILSDLEKDIIPFLKTLDLEIHDNGFLSGALEKALDNCREASIYARALRVNRVMGASLETQKRTKMSYQEAYDMIKNEAMEQHMNTRLREKNTEFKIKSKEIKNGK